MGVYEINIYYLWNTNNLMDTTEKQEEYSENYIMIKIAYKL